MANDGQAGRLGGLRTDTETTTDTFYSALVTI